MIFQETDFIIKVEKSQLLPEKKFTWLVANRRSQNKLALLTRRQVFHLHRSSCSPSGKIKFCSGVQRFSKVTSQKSGFMDKQVLSSKRKRCSKGYTTRALRGPVIVDKGGKPTEIDGMENLYRPTNWTETRMGYHSTEGHVQRIL